MAFRPIKKTDELDYKSAVLGNSATLAVGDAVIPGATTHAPFLVKAQNATDTSQYTGIVLGVITGIFNNGKPSEKKSVTTASDNETTGLYSAEYIPTYIPIEYVADMSADLGTTTGSGTYLAMFYLGYNATGHHNTAFPDQAQLDESSVAVFTTQLHFFSYGAYKSGTINASTGAFTQVSGIFTSSKAV